MALAGCRVGFWRRFRYVCPSASRVLRAVSQRSRASPARRRRSRPTESISHTSTMLRHHLRVLALRCLGALAPVTLNAVLFVLFVQGTERPSVLDGLLVLHRPPS